ncbi:MAG: CBS domain-containing protein, partial [Desulfococcaceae bacterium]
LFRSLMLKKNIKRLPVTDDQGKLTGILSRMDIFRTITNQMPDWDAIRKQNIPVGDLKYVSDIMRRDIHTVLPETPAEEVLQLIASNDIQRVAVVNPEGIFLGLISDRNLLSAFSDRKEGIWEYFASRLPFAERKTKHRDLSTHLQSMTAADIMKTGAATALETDTVDRAIHLMTEKVIKRLPVLDAEGKFRGMISRESLLRAGFLSS